MDNSLSPFLFEDNLHTLVWGTEAWIVSAVPSSPSVISNGKYAGKSLPEVVNMFPAEILGTKTSAQFSCHMPLLAKLIDAHQDLSIQVHPNDDMAQRLHHQNGKSEMWYVIDAKPDSYIYSGFKEPLTKEQYQQRVADGTIVDALAKHTVKPGDVFYLPSGRVHAIGRGIRLAEIQQSSDITYRIFDYNRLGLDGKPRELHTEWALQAINFDVQSNYRTIYNYVENNSTHCIDSEYFSIRIINTKVPFHRNLVKFDSFVIIMCIDGECQIVPRSNPSARVSVSTGKSCLVPAMMTNYDIIPDGRNVQLLEAFIDNKNRSLLHRSLRFLHITSK